MDLFTKNHVKTQISMAFSKKKYIFIQSGSGNGRNFYSPSFIRKKSIMLFKKIRFVIIFFQFADWLKKAGIFKLLEDPIPKVYKR